MRVFEFSFIMRKLVKTAVFLPMSESILSDVVFANAGDKINKISRHLIIL